MWIVPQNVSTLRVATVCVNFFSAARKNSEEITILKTLSKGNNRHCKAQTEADKGCTECPSRKQAWSKLKWNSLSSIRGKTEQTMKRQGTFDVERKDMKSAHTTLPW